MGALGLIPSHVTHVLIILTSAVMHTSGHTLKNVIIGSQGHSIFSFVGKLHTVFHSGRTSSRCHQQCGRAWPVPVRLSPHSLALRDALSSGVLIRGPSQALCVPP